MHKNTNIVLQSISKKVATRLHVESNV